MPTRILDLRAHIDVHFVDGSNDTMTVSEFDRVAELGEILDSLIAHDETPAETVESLTVTIRASPDDRNRDSE